MPRATAAPTVRQSLRDQYRLLGQVLAHELQLAFPSLGQQTSNELSNVFVSLMYGHWTMVASLGLDAQCNRVARAAMSQLIRATTADDRESIDNPAVWAIDPSQN